MKKITLALAIVFLLPAVTFAQTSGQNTQFTQTMPSLNTGSLLSQVGGNQTQTNQIVSSCGNLTTTGLTGVSGCIIGILDNIVVLLMAAAVVVVVWGAFQMIYSEAKRESGKLTVVYGIIGLFVMVSIWGLVNILTNTFHLNVGYQGPSASLLHPPVSR